MLFFFYESFVMFGAYTNRACKALLQEVPDVLRSVSLLTCWIITPLFPLSLRERAGERGSIQRQLPDLDSLILAFSRREKGCSFSFTSNS